MRLRNLCQRREEVFLELFIWQLSKLFGKVAIGELLHVPLVVPADFFAFDTSVEHVSIELSHEAEASAHEVPILLLEDVLLLGILAGAVDRRLREVNRWN